MVREILGTHCQIKVSTVIGVLQAHDLNLEGVKTASLALPKQEILKVTVISQKSIAHQGCLIQGVSSADCNESLELADTSFAPHPEQRQPSQSTEFGKKLLCHDGRRKDEPALLPIV